MSELSDDKTESKAHDDWGPITTVIVWGGRVLAVLSAFMLVHEAFTVSLSAPFSRMFTWYNSLVLIFGEIVRPVMEFVVQVLSGWFPELALGADWQHQLVLSTGLIGSIFPLCAVALTDLLGERRPAPLLILMFVSVLALVFLCVIMVALVFVDTSISSRLVPALSRTQLNILIVLGLLLAQAWSFRNVYPRIAQYAAAVPVGVLFLVVTNAGLGLINL
jgi:hypothetical protein